MKLKKEPVILILIIIALSLYLVLHESNRTQYQLPDLPKLALKEINRLDIQQSGNTITLNKRDNKWYIEPGNYLADAGAVDQMLDVTANLTLTALASESKSYERYDLESDKKITVKAWSGQTLSREFDIGKPVPTYQHTFVLLAGDPSVYHAKGNFRSQFDETVDKLRDKTVLSFEKNQIQKIGVSKGGTVKEYMLVSVPEEPAEKSEESEKKPQNVKMQWQTSDNKIADENAIDGLLVQLEGLKCETYEDNKTKEDYQNPIYDIKLGGSITAALSIFEKSDKEANQYPAISSQNEYPFFLSEYKGKNIIEKLDSLLKQAD